MEKSDFTGSEGEMHWTQMPPMEAVVDAMDAAEAPTDTDEELHWTQMPSMSAIDEAMAAANR